MRFLHSPVLASALMLLVTGCGHEAQQESQAKIERADEAAAPPRSTPTSSKAEHFSGSEELFDEAPARVPRATSEPAAPSDAVFEGIDTGEALANPFIHVGWSSVVVF